MLSLYGDSSPGLRSNVRQEYLSLINDFVFDIDNFVTLLEDTSERKIQSLKLAMVISLALTLCVVLSTLYLVTTRVLAPLDRLLVCANSARRGDFSARTHYTANDELGQLGVAFNVMSEDLSKLYSNLEARVQEKTADLERSNQSLELLYNTIRLLSEAPLSDKTYENLLRDIEKPLGLGPGAICLGQNALTSQLVLASTRNAIDDVPDVCSHLNCSECYADGATHTFEAVIGDQQAQLISTPIKDQDAQVGVLFMEVLSGGEVEERQTQMLETVARHVGMALNLTQRVTESRRLALLEERGAIARELHDSLAQSLSYLKIQATRLDVTISKPNTEQEVKVIISEMRDGISSAYRQLRELLTTFRLKIEESGLTEAIEKTVEDWQGRTDIQISLENRLEECQLNAHQEIHVLQLVREILSNAMNHSKAEHVQVKLLFDSNSCRVTISIEDDGIGIPES
ncbi:histidine kinase, partial [Pseudomonadota bacterium]